ncbi:flagellar hook protein FlgE [Lentisalinibacter salinarum]|uniref:flagellar hook protein FlgE n=1 Tax=Lentisalinibacter salinarum TaxID=2992239 RepID=UPI003867ED28
MPFRIALSGLNAASADLGVTANNIANVNTTGFKGSRAEFAEVFAVGTQSTGSSAVGSGVRLSNISQQFAQGNVDFTDNALDLAIGGEGFFVLSDNGSRVYTRAGNFSVDNNGFVVNPAGKRLQAYPPSGDGNFNTGSLNDVQLSTGANPPQSTTAIDYGVNLPADAEVPTIVPFDPADPNTFNHTTSVTIYDSLGAAHTGTLYFLKDAATNTWNTQFTVDGNVVGAGDQLVFGNDGQLQSPAGGVISLPAYSPSNGAADITMSLNLDGATQFGSNFGVNSLSQDGFATGRLTGIEVTSEGILFARFTNGQSTELGKIALADFANPGGLQQLEDTAWGESFTSGDARLGEAGTSSFGLIQSGALEASNVDLTEQLVNMITAQRNFQANSQMISTADTVTQTVINIR